jgi:cobalt-zinc-cadmium efflux system protein
MSQSHAHAEHNHSADPGHGHSHAPPSNNLAFAVGITLNVGFVVAEVVYSLSAHSLALLSDAGHNLSDVFALLIAWGAIYLGKSSPTKRHTYGLRRSSILAALTNAVLLLIVVGGITWEAIGRILQPEAVVGSTVMWVAAIGVVINTISALLFMNGREHDLNIKGAFVHMASDAAVSLSVVVAGLTISMTGWYWLDPAVSIVISGVIVGGTWGLLRESVNLAMDAAPEGIDPHAVESYLAGLEGVDAVHDLHIWAMSTTETALTVHLVMPRPPADDKFLHQVAHGLTERFRIGHITVQIEHGDEDITCHQEPANVV